MFQFRAGKNDLTIRQIRAVTGNPTDIRAAVTEAFQEVYHGMEAST